jgi:hypothetical protein
MSKLVTTEKLEAAFEFIRIANERGGYVHLGHDVIETLPILQSLLLCPENNTHLPEPPKKEMFQMWRDSEGYYAAYPVSDGAEETTKIVEPFEFTYPEESEK